MERHVALVLLTFVVLQLLRLDPLETVGEVKRRLQLKVIKGGTPSPTPSISMSRRGELVVVVERRRRTTKPNPGWEGSFSC